MSKKIKQTALGGSSLAALVILTAVAQAHSVRFDQVNSVNTDLKTATDLALTAVPGMIVEAELERENGHFVWEIEIVDSNQQRVSVELDGQSGEIIEQQVENGTSPDLADILSLDEALSIVQITDNDILVEAELEEEDGELVWEFESIDSQNVKSEQRVHGTTGNVI